MKFTAYSILFSWAVIHTMTASAVIAQGNNPPNTPSITEPSAPNMLLNPHDVHMETTMLSDPDVGDTHAGSDWEIWTTTQPAERIWFASDVTGPEKVHAHLGDGVFMGSLAGNRRLEGLTDYVLRVRHRDSSGDPATQWSQYASIPFSTSAAFLKESLLLEDISDNPAPRWVDMNNVEVELPSGTPHATMRIETQFGWQLIRVDGRPGPGNTISNPDHLPRHQAVRVIFDAGATGGNLVLPATDFIAFEHDCERFIIRLPAINLAPNQQTVFWVSADGATYDGNASPNRPDFSTPVRGLQPPWVAREPGYSVEIVAEGFRMPVNIAFVPNPGPNSSDPKFYVTELYGTVRVVSNDMTVSTFASGLLNYTPSGAFPGSGEQGLAGIAIDPVTGDVYVGHLWRSGGGTFPRVTRLVSTDGGRTSSSRQVILDMPGESQGQSHFISNLEIVNGQLYVHNGDGFDARTARNPNSFRGKILRMNLDGSPVTNNPFFNAGPRDARDYIYALGVRNPFGGAYRASDNSRYLVENGPSVDRFAKIVRGRDYRWDGSNASMRNFAIHNWDPAAAPVSIEFIQPQTFGGSGFPPERWDHAFVTESGPTYAEGQQELGKRITEFTLDAAGNLISGPLPFVDYVGDGFATAVALAAGPDGLYFSEFYLDENPSGPTDLGGRVIRISYGSPEDCNANGDPDSCEIALGLAADCNSNGVPDACDIRDGTSPDVNGNGIPDPCEMLAVSAAQTPVVTGGQIDFSLRAGADKAGLGYLLVGSTSGTTPGTQLGDVTLPLNIVGDPWFFVTARSAGSATFPGTRGALDPRGESNAAIVLPPMPASVRGLTLHHAYVVFDASLGVVAASNAVSTELM